jgi:hypothetical protein
MVYVIVVPTDPSLTRVKHDLATALGTHIDILSSVIIPVSPPANQENIKFGKTVRNWPFGGRLVPWGAIQSRENCINPYAPGYCQASLSAEPGHFMETIRPENSWSDGYNAHRDQRVVRFHRYSNLLTVTLPSSCFPTGAFEIRFGFPRLPGP